MELERETVREIIVSVLAVGAFVATVIAIGTIYNGDGLSNQGALALVGAIAAFILGMGAIGFYLAYQQ
jgi:hypothetical protein